MGLLTPSPRTPRPSPHTALPRPRLNHLQQLRTLPHAVNTRKSPTLPLHALLPLSLMLLLNRTTDRYALLHVVSTLLLYGSTRHVMMKNLGVKHFRLSLEDTKQNAQRGTPLGILDNTW